MDSEEVLKACSMIAKKIAEIDIDIAGKVVALKEARETREAKYTELLELIREQSEPGLFNQVDLNLEQYEPSADDNAASKEKSTQRKKRRGKSNL